MKIFEIQQRDAQLLQNLYNIGKPRSSNPFLSIQKGDSKNRRICPKSLQEVPHLIVAANAKEMPLDSWELPIEK